MCFLTSDGDAVFLGGVCEEERNRQTADLAFLIGEQRSSYPLSTSVSPLCSCCCLLGCDGSHSRWSHEAVRAAPECIARIADLLDTGMYPPMHGVPRSTPVLLFAKLL